LKKILVTGASGMLGSYLIDKLNKKHIVYATANTENVQQLKNYMKFDLNSSSYMDLIKWSSPDIIIHCAAIIDSNYCENNPYYSFLINGYSVKKILDSTDKNVRIIYISTDAVFGSSTHMANEKDFVNPESIYGKSKELGEFFLKSSLNQRKYTILRTTIVGFNYNKINPSFVDWIINFGKEKKELGLFTDVLFTPISIWDFSEEISFLIDSENINSEILHLGGELCTKFDFGKKLLKSLDISTENVKPSSIKNFKGRVGRSKDQSLDSSFYKSKYKRKLPNLKQTIKTIKKHYEQN